MTLSLTLGSRLRSWRSKESKRLKRASMTRMGCSLRRGNARLGLLTSSLLLAWRNFMLSRRKCKRTLALSKTQELGVLASVNEVISKLSKVKNSLYLKKIQMPIMAGQKDNYTCQIENTPKSFIGSLMISSTCLSLKRSKRVKTEIKRIITVYLDHLAGLCHLTLSPF